MSKVTIVIPIYKPNPKYLRELFNSIQSQLYTDFDVVISDDGDDGDIIHTLLPDALTHKTLYICNTLTHGIFGNLNNGLWHAKGDYIQIFCQDDVMLPTLLGNNLKSLEENPEAGFVFTMCNFIIGTDQYVDFDYGFIQFIPKILLPVEANNFFLYFGCIPGNLSTVMLRKKLLDEVGLFNETYQFAGDYEFWVRSAQHKQIIFSKEMHLHVRNHSSSASMTLGTFTRYHEIKNIYKFLIDNNSIPLYKKTLRRYLHRNLLRAILAFIAVKNIKMRKSDWKVIRKIFDGKPYSYRLALLSFLSPVTPSIKKLIRHMEIVRD